MTAAVPQPPALARRFGIMPGFLFRPEEPLAFVLKAWPLVLLPSLLLSWLVSFAAPTAEGPAISIHSARMILMIVLGAPLIETAIMLLPLLILNRLFGPVAAVVLSAVGWAIAHGSAAWIWGLVVWWPFLIFSIALLVWRERSLLAGYFVVAAIHALQNGFAVVAVLALRDLPGGPAS